MKRGGAHFVLKLAGVFLAYFITARIGLTFDAVSGFATLVWPPTGIAMAAMIIFGYEYWLGIALAAFFANLMNGAPPFVALGISTGNTLEALTGAYLLQNVMRIDTTLERLRDVLGLIVVAALFSTTVSATIGVTCLLFANIVSTATYASTWVAWWVGDALGVLVIAPLLLVWSRQRLRRLRILKLVEAALSFGLLAAVSFLVFRGYPQVGIQPFALVYVVFPLLMWTALRFGQLGSVTSILVVACIAIWTAATSFSSPYSTPLSYRLLLLQTFIGITATTFMTFAAIVAERTRSLKRQQLLETRTELLTKQRTNLRGLNRAKDEFIALASHQLRTPATSVKQYLGMMLENFAGKLTPQQRHMLTVAYESNERQIHILEDLLKVAQVDMGKVVLRKRRTDIVKMVSAILEAMHPTFATNQQEVTFTHAKPRILSSCDKERIHMVLENLIHNASKYTSPGKKIEIAITQNRRRVVVTLTDQGVGIAKKDVPKLFKKFSRIHNPLSIAAGGSGLGLYWAKKVVDLHGGAIRVTSELHEGSTFTVELPGA